MTVRKASCTGKRPQASPGGHAHPPFSDSPHRLLHGALLPYNEPLGHNEHRAQDQKFPQSFWKRSVVFVQEGNAQCLHFCPECGSQPFPISTACMAAGSCRDNSLKSLLHLVVLMNSKHHVTPCFSDCSTRSPDSGQEGAEQSVCVAAFWSIEFKGRKNPVLDKNRPLATSTEEKTERSGGGERPRKDCPASAVTPRRGPRGRPASVSSSSSSKLTKEMLDTLLT